MPTLRGVLDQPVHLNHLNCSFDTPAQRRHAGLALSFAGRQPLEISVDALVGPRLYIYEAEAELPGAVDDVGFGQFLSAVFERHIVFLRV